MKIKKFKPTDHHLKVVLYGPSGSGKTYFGATAKNVLFASAEGGMLSTMATAPGTDYVEISSLADMNDLANNLESRDLGYDTLVVDSISEISEIIKERLSSKRRGGLMQQQDWGELSRSILALLRRLRNLPMHVIFIAQEKQVKDDQKIDRYAPMLDGKAATQLCYFMDIVARTYVDKQGQYKITTAPSAQLETKDRSGLIGGDAPLSFPEWVKSIEALDTGEEEVVADMKDPLALIDEEYKAEVIALIEKIAEREGSDLVDVQKRVSGLIKKGFQKDKLAQLNNKQAENLIGKLQTALEQLDEQEEEKPKSKPKKTKKATS